MLHLSKIYFDICIKIQLAHTFLSGLSLQFHLDLSHQLEMLSLSNTHTHTPLLGIYFVLLIYLSLLGLVYAIRSLLIPGFFLKFTNRSLPHYFLSISAS